MQDADRGVTQQRQIVMGSELGPAEAPDTGRRKEPGAGPGGAQGEPLSMELDLLTAFGVGAAVAAAQNTGLLELALSQTFTAAEHAQRLKLNERTTRAVLDMLTALGLIERCDDRYGPRAGGAGPQALSPAFLPLVHGVFTHTERVLRTGEPIPELDASETANRESTYTQVVGALGKMYANLAEYLAAQITTPPARILDVGCGSGVWSLAIAARHPGTRVTGLDFPRVLDVFCSHAAQLGLTARIDTLPGDMHTQPLPPEHFDLLIVANVLRLEPVASAQALVARLGCALKPGGRMLIVDALAAGTPARELVRSAYMLHLTLRTESGRVHSPVLIKEWMAAAGLSRIEEIDCGRQITAIGALLGQKDG